MILDSRCIVLMDQTMTDVELIAQNGFHIVMITDDEIVDGFAKKGLAFIEASLW